MSVYLQLAGICPTARKGLAPRLSSRRGMTAWRRKPGLITVKAHGNALRKYSSASFFFMDAILELHSTFPARARRVYRVVRKRAKIEDFDGTRYLDVSGKYFILSKKTEQENRKGFHWGFFRYASWLVLLVKCHLLSFDFKFDKQ